MEIENTRSDTVKPSEDPKACCASDTKSNSDCKYSFGKLCNHINEKPVTALGIAAAAGFLMGWLLTGKNK